MKNKLMIAVVCSMALMITACGQDEMVESGIQKEVSSQLENQHF